MFWPKVTMPVNKIVSEHLKIRLLGTVKPAGWYDERVTFDPTICKTFAMECWCWGPCTEEFLMLQRSTRLVFC